MKFISTKGRSEPVSFSEAVLKGLAPDGGLYVPDQWPALPPQFWNDLSGKNLEGIGYEISRLFIEELNDETLKSILSETLSFDAPLVHLQGRLHILELFHGPTLAFKDFGARFMSRIFSVIRQSDQDIIILAATSGDTGSAVAQGFLGVDGIQVCLLYPGGKVSRLQEQQLTTAGQNVTVFEVDGTFDDCQKMVKQAFSDRELNEELVLSSANSINISRLLPQTFYYAYAVSQLQDAQFPIVSVPSGNFGNLTAGLIAQKMGMPVSGFLAATNINDVVPEYLISGEFRPRPSKRTISNAMDVGNPSNFDRIEYLFDGSHKKIRNQIWGASFSDEQTKKAIKKVYKSAGYIMDPHTAIGYLAVQKYLKEGKGYFEEDESSPFIILATAHPAKFKDVIEPLINHQIKLPYRLKASLQKEKQSIKIEANFDALKEWILNSY